MVVHSPVPDSYTVRYAATNHRDEPHVLVITRGFGDGDEARWPEQGPDMSLLGQDNDKQQQWRRTAAEVIAKDLGLMDETHQHWILDELPTGYGLFQQITHPKDAPAGPSGGAGKSKLRLDRFIFGHNSKKIRSALSLGKHISNQVFGARSTCHCDGCKVTQPKASASSMADIGAPLRMAPRKRKRTGEYAEIAGYASRADTGEPEGSTAAATAAAGGDDDGASTGTGTEREGSVAASGDSPDKRPARKVRKSAAGARKRFAASGEDGDDYGEGAAGEESDYEEPSFTSTDYSRVGARTSSGRRTKPSERLLSGMQQEARVQALTSVVKDAGVVDEFGENMAPAGKDVVVPSSLVSPAQVAEDLAHPTLSRVGELVWVRVPLGPPPSGAPETAQLSRWPGIVRSRVVTPAASGVPRDEVYRVELLGMSQQDVLEGVRSENVTPWTGYVPSNTAWLDQNPLVDDGLRAGQEKKRWAEIQAEGWLGVANAFRKAQRIGKAYAAIQIRPIPTLVTGAHLASKPTVPPTSLAALERKGPESRYLSHSHVIYGPELIHVGDYVRLCPYAELDPSIVASRTPHDASARLLPLTLVMRVSALYRGGKGSPLVARGHVFEHKPVPGERDAALEPPRDESLQALPRAIVDTLPLPFPFHTWRLLAPAATEPGSALETDVLVSQAVAGRYYPLGLAAMDPPPSREETTKVINAWLEEASNGLGVWQDGRGAKGGKGEEGIKALTLLLSGVAAGERAPRIVASKHLAGSRVEQYIVAEEQALGRPHKLGEAALGAEDRRPGDKQVIEPAAAAAVEPAPTSAPAPAPASAPAPAPAPAPASAPAPAPAPAPKPASTPKAAPAKPAASTATAPWPAPAPKPKLVASAAPVKATTDRTAKGKSRASREVAQLIEDEERRTEAAKQAREREREKRRREGKVTLDCTVM
ncbi:hypothetical protein JCM3775_004514 [Rhodotorula graminis]